MGWGLARGGCHCPCHHPAWSYTMPFYHSQSHVRLRGLLTGLTPGQLCAAGGRHRTHFLPCHSDPHGSAGRGWPRCPFVVGYWLRAAAWWLIRRVSWGGRAGRCHDVPRGAGCPPGKRRSVRMRQRRHCCCALRHAPSLPTHPHVPLRPF